MSDHTEHEKPTADEQYSSAINASNLRVDNDADRRGQADVIMAAAWSPTQFGALMLRLHGEWDSSSKPERPTDAAVRALAATVETTKDGKPVRLGLPAATKRAAEWYQQELLALIGRLKSLPMARHQVALHMANGHTVSAARQADMAHLAASIIKYWLDQTCQKCDGRRWKTIPGTPMLSNRVCDPQTGCGGSGFGRVPGGEAGRALINYIDECVGRARSSIRRRLANTVGRKET